MKQTEKKGKVTRRLKRKGPEKAWRSILDRVRKDSSPLSRAYQLTQIASRAGFDWPTIGGVLEKLDEEMREFKEALALQDRKKICEEIGISFCIGKRFAVSPPPSRGRIEKNIRQICISILLH